MSFRKLDILFFEMFSFVFFNTHTDSKVFVTKILQPIKEFESERIHEEENIDCCTKHYHDSDHVRVLKTER